MFKSSQKKIIVSIMVSLTALFAVTLAVILLASFREIKINNSQMLERYVQSYSLTPPSGKQVKADYHINDTGKPPKDARNFALATFYSVAVSADGTVIAVDDGGISVYTAEDLTALAEEVLRSGKTEGKADALTYCVSPKDSYTLVAFLDNTVTNRSMQMLLKNFLLIGGCAMVLLFGLSFFLSKRIIRPLEENDRQQKQFISDASHELKTPVAVIAANAELLFRELGSNEWLDNIQYENERMGELVKSLLDLSRAENPETPMEPTDFSRVVTGEVLTFESLAFDMGKNLQSEIAENITISGSQSQLAQLVSILLDNALRHSTGDEINLSLKKQNHFAVLSVANTGDEIPAEKLPHLFERFYRVDEARSGEDQHYGLGLSIAKTIAEKHGGKIGVSCKDGIICFTVSLPV